MDGRVEFNDGTTRQLLIQLSTRRLSNKSIASDSTKDVDGGVSDMASQIDDDGVLMEISFDCICIHECHHARSVRFSVTLRGVQGRRVRG